MNCKRPLPRRFREDIPDPEFHDFVELALTRMHHTVVPKSSDPPPVLFPLGEKRGAPFASECTLQGLLSQTSVLVGWPAVASILKIQATATLKYVSESQCKGISGRDLTTKADYLTTPIDYEATQLLAQGSSTSAMEYLHIHAFLKDHVQGLHKSFKLQHFFFTHLLQQFQVKVKTDSLGLDDLEQIAAQAAKESSYLACPLLERSILIHFQAHHQLSYANIPLDSLARAEFSVPLHVLEVAEEMLQASAANGGQACPIVPILVATSPKFEQDLRYITSIVDGNNCATAAMLLRFLANHPLLTDFPIMSQHLLEYCKIHHLGKKWAIDLSDVLDYLYNQSSRQIYHSLLDSHQIIRKFAQVEYIPALVVQEEDFHTICKQRSAGKPKPVLLHPFHQTLFNDDYLLFALPQKVGQTHGRPEAFRLLSLSPFGTTRDGLGIDHGNIFRVDVLQSMNGLEQ